uniref:PH domain-containing protein n=1 Tax=Steinernema glaseri TaxID=37863 RepID=A0A1I7ZPN7_9BILA
MDDDNAFDVYKWIDRLPSDQCDLEAELQMKYEGEFVPVQVRLKGNLLAIKSADRPIESLLIVIEKLNVERIDERNAFVLSYGSSQLELAASSKEQLESWVVRIATCSHQMALAELDQTAYKLQNLPTPLGGQSPGSSNQVASYFLTQPYSKMALAELDQTAYKLQNLPTPLGGQSPGSCNQVASYFLTQPYSKVQSFAITQQNNLPSRKIVCEEVMYESKLCTLLPSELLKIHKKAAMDLRKETEHRIKPLLSRVPPYMSFSGIRAADLLRACCDTMQVVRNNLETYDQAAEFQDAYTGPSFRPSKEKSRVAFGFCPTNLHAQYLHLDSRPVGHMLSVGAATAIPFGFVNGGASRMRNNLHSSIDDPTRIDYVIDSRFHSRRRTLLAAKKSIGEMSRRIDIDCKSFGNGQLDRMGVQLFADVKHLRENTTDLVSSFPGCGQLVDILQQCTSTQSSVALPDGVGITDNLENMLDTLDAAMISLDTKMAVLDTLQDSKENRQSYEKSARQSLNSALDCLLALVQSMLDAQLIGIIVALCKPKDLQLHFQLQLRSDSLVSQTTTIVATALLTAIERHVAANKTPSVMSQWETFPPLLVVFGFLSCYGDEKGMLEDMRDAYGLVGDRVRFRFVTATSSVARTCVPVVGGDRGLIDITLPLPPPMFAVLPKKMASSEWFHPKVILWNLGINHEASFALNFGDASLERDINLSALSQTISFAEAHSDASLADILKELKHTTLENPSNKNMQIFRWVMTLTASLGGVSALSCKSGKDRTSMAVTLEEGRLIKETCGLPASQINDMIVCLRRSGVRLENCRKNVGKPIYSFSPFQMHFIPKELRPPAGTYAQGVAS